MRRFNHIDWSHDIDIFYKHYGTGYLYNVIGWCEDHTEYSRLRRLLVPRRCDIQDYIYIQPHGIFSSAETLGNWFEEFLQAYQYTVEYIQFRTNLEVCTIPLLLDGSVGLKQLRFRRYHFAITPMKLDVGTVGEKSCHYDGLKFDTFPPPGCPIMTHNGKIIGHMPKDELEYKR